MTSALPLPSRSHQRRPCALREHLPNELGRIAVAQVYQRLPVRVVSAGFVFYDEEQFSQALFVREIEGVDILQGSVVICRLYPLAQKFVETFRGAFAAAKSGRRKRFCGFPALSIFSGCRQSLRKTSCPCRSC